MTKTAVVSLWLVVGALAPNLAFSDAACEGRIRATGLIFVESDPKSICDQKPSKETQDCLIEVITKTRGKLRNTDLFEVYGTCRADPSPAVRTCLAKGMQVAWNDPKYRSASAVGSECLLKRKPTPLKSSKSAPRKTPKSAPKKGGTR